MVFNTNPRGMTEKAGLTGEPLLSQPSA